MAKGKLAVVRGAGDNNPDKPIDGEKLQNFIDEIEENEQLIAPIRQQIKEILATAKAVGYQPKMIRRILKERKIDPEKRQNEESTYALYKAALGMIDD